MSKKFTACITQTIKEILIAILSSVYGWILLQRVIKEYECTPFLANGFSMTLGGALALVHSYLGGESWAPTPVTNWQPFIITSVILNINHVKDFLFLSILMLLKLLNFALAHYQLHFHLKVVELLLKD